MCGLAGVYAYHPAANRADIEELVRIRDSMSARGPDHAGIWCSQNERVALAHRRLSIIDLSSMGNQPMSSECGRYVIVYNGEIYNYPALREKLERLHISFRSDSDTEILLHLFALRGTEMLQELRGMFAFVIWDNLRNTLFAARDPFGIKPLYYSDDGWTFRFASQVKALQVSAAISEKLSITGVAGFYLWGSVPEPFTVFEDIHGLPAGCYMWIDATGVQKTVPYFSLQRSLTAGRNGGVTDSADVGVFVREAAKESIAAHLLSDVEVGVFLSAGIDSGAILGLMRDLGVERIHAITLGFKEFKDTYEDEAPLAKAVADHYGAKHTVRYVDQNEFFEDLPQILEHMDQPSIDGINTWFVAKAAREAGLKVALSGLGSDELLAGYPSFVDIPKWVSWMRVVNAVPKLGRLLRRILTAGAFEGVNPKMLGLPEYGGYYAGAYLLRRGLFMPWELKDKIDAPLMDDESLRRLLSLEDVKFHISGIGNSSNLKVAALEVSQYMRNQLLRDADWAGMAHGVEIRTPFVDKNFIDQIAPVLKFINTREGKDALALAPSNPLPKTVYGRSKTGFGVPIQQWMAKIHGKELDTISKGQASRAWADYVLSKQLGRDGISAQDAVAVRSS